MIESPAFDNVAPTHRREMIGARHLTTSPQHIVGGPAFNNAAPSTRAPTQNAVHVPRIALSMADNTTAESWIIRACTSSAIGRALGRVQCAPMINNPLGINCGHVCSEDNEVAERISCILNETN